MIEMNAAQVIARLQDVHRNQIPFALSNALRQTTQGAQVEAAKGAARAFDRPTNVITKQGRGGAIRARWDNKNKIRGEGFRQAQGAVFVIDPLVDEMHLQVFGGITRSVPDSARAVLQPTKALTQGIRGQGRFNKLNRFGNIQGLLQGAIGQAKRDPSKFLNVPLNNSNPKTRHLSPGLYAKTTQRTQRSAIGQRGRTRRGTGRGSLVMLIRYERQRTYDRRFKYDDIVLNYYKQNFGTNLSTSLIDAIRTAR